MPIRSSPIPFTPSADTSILPIVTSQRDRFRQRNAELEEVCVSLANNLLGFKQLIANAGTTETIRDYL